ncbi:PREDICTED: solute carrier family 28 member 3-like [Habropoda laboriosa]|uniref:solute carrier family 28 member 3-like n=1 Tax=Habropoda laboriosa TaxID=597456 RepID=UPI00083E5BB7|nr:PREDICTED: solute carrier family 28 member 3-like [Habropoda laboriosa]
MSGTASPAFESIELNMLETGYLADESIKGGKGTTEETAGCFRRFYTFLSKYRRASKFLSLTLLNLVVLIYFVFATIHWRTNKYQDSIDWCNGYGLLIVLVTIIYGGILYHFIAKRFHENAPSRCKLPFRDLLESIEKTRYGGIIGQTVIYTCVILAIIVFLIIDTADSRERLMSGVGVVILMSFGWIFSKHPGRINWRPVMCGLILQFLFGLLIIRWPVGRSIFECLAGKIEGFLNVAKSGASFVYSDELVDHGVFAFSTLPVIFYFSFIIQILYYLGAMQWVILNLGQILQSLMGTSICESVICAANIFIGMTESPLVIKPYLNKLTTSELHTIMCSGFATVSGTVLAAYIKFGANPAHLITASLMAAPAALCYAKLFYPETEKSEVTPDNINLEKSNDSSLMDAASKGAMAAVPLVLGIIANIIAFVSFITLTNEVLSWIGMLVGYNGLSFELILSKVFIPLSWIMGVPWDKCEYVATLIGLKTVVNEFVAYQALGKFKEQGKIYGRTEAIATFAICGFANPSSIGITLSVLSSLAPDKKENVASAVGRAFVAGSAVNFLTASIAGMLISDDYYPVNATIALNMTAR